MRGKLARDLEQLGIMRKSIAELELETEQAAALIVEQGLAAFEESLACPSSQRAHAVHRVDRLEMWLEMRAQHLGSGRRNGRELDPVIGGEIYHLLAHPTRIEHARQSTRGDPKPGGEQHRGDDHFIGVASEDRPMAAA